MKFCVFRLVSLSVLLLLLHGCQDDDILEVYPEKVSIYQKGFTLEAFEDPIIKENLIVNWSSPVEFTDADGTIMYEFESQVGNGSALEGQSLTLTQKYSVVVPEVIDDSPLEYKLVRFLSNNDVSLVPVSYHDKSDFTGTVYYYDLKGRTEKLEGYKDGTLKSTFEDMEKGEITPTSKVPKYCGFDSSNCESGSYVPIFKTYVTDWYVFVGNVFSYKRTSPEYTRMEYVWVSTGVTVPRPGEKFHDHRDAPAPHGPGGSHASNHPSEILSDDYLDGYDFHAETAEIKAFEQDYRNRMSNSEKSIFNNLSRFQQLDYLHSAYLAQTYAKLFFTDNVKVQYNGKGDAYRHCLWNALSTAKIGESLTKQLTDAHEIPNTGTTNNPLEKTMDLHNNGIGRQIGKNSILTLMTKVKTAVENGETKYITPTNANGTTINGISQIKPTNQ